MSQYKKVDLSGIRLNSITDRHSLVELGQAGKAFDSNGSFQDFVASLPDVLMARQLNDFVANVAQAAKRSKPIVWMLGAHVVKVGLTPIVVDLVENGLCQCVAMNSAAAIHDTESCLFGKTSEDVAEAITDGSFGMSKQTGDFINGTLQRAYESDDKEIGYGEALGVALAASSSASPSILATCVRKNVPVTVHAAIGTDITHQQPTMSGEATGELSFRDFRALAHVVQSIGDGGVVINVGSAVILPEVFLKALTVARNLGSPVQNFTTANFDMIQHYRPGMNVVSRPTKDSGRGFSFTGHHEIMIPLLAAMIKLRLSENR